MRTLSAPGLDKMVSRQVRRWALREEHERTECAPTCVALSRLPGAGGAELGKRVAEDLGYGFFGIELVDQIARAGHVHPHLVTRLDERVRDAIERFVNDGIHSREYVESDYIEALMRVLGTFAERGMAVLLGRGAAYALPADRTLRVLVVASDSFRLNRLRTATGLTEEGARERLAYEEAQRKQFNHNYFDVNPDDAALYDLVVNTESLGFVTASDLVTRTFHARFGPSVATSARLESTTHPPHPTHTAHP